MFFRTGWYSSADDVLRYRPAGDAAERYMPPAEIRAKNQLRELGHLEPGQIENIVLKGQPCEVGTKSLWPFVFGHSADQPSNVVVLVSSLLK